LVAAVRNRYDIPQRWYRIKAQLFGIDRLADYDRNASVATGRGALHVGGGRRTGAGLLRVVLTRARRPRRALLRRAVDRRPDPTGKSPGAFCSYTVPEVHPYVMLNFTGGAPTC
jgi:oligoendopeptidase F